VCTMLLTAPGHHELVPAVCTLVEVGGVQWMETATMQPHVSGASFLTLTKAGQRYVMADRKGFRQGATQV
jgi:hypothetical protein